MKKTFFSFSVLMVIFFSGCSKSSSSTGVNNANVMFVNACANGSQPLNLDGKVNNVAVPGAANLQILFNSGYQVIPAGTNVDLSFWVTGGKELVNTTTNLAYNEHYSVFAFGPPASPRIAIVADPMYKSPSGNAQVRFFNFSTGNPRLFCYFGSTLLDSVEYYYNDFNPAPATPFYEVTPGTATLLLKDPANPAYSAYIENQTFSANKIYTVMFTDTSATTGLAGFYLSVITNY